MSVLMRTGLRRGQTARIAEYVAAVIQDHGADAQAVNIKGSDDDPAPDGNDAVIVGASIHMGKHERYVSDFVRKHRDVLERLPSAFFSVGPAAYDDREEAQGYIEKFVQETAWHPAMIGLFGGALLYTQYGFIKRRLMKEIARDKGTLDTAPRTTTCTRTGRA